MVPDNFEQKLSELDKIQETCHKLLLTKHYHALGEHGIHAIMARAMSLGIHPFEALNGGFYVVSGRVGMSTEMMAALVRRRGHSITKDPKSTPEKVILHGKRADNGDTWTCVFTKEDAVAAGLWNSTTWKKYPAVMLYNRCMSMLFRQLFPDLSLGAGYVKDELDEIAKEHGPQVFKDIEVEAIPEDVKQIDVKQLDKPVIDADQLSLIEYYIGDDEAYRKGLLKRLSAIRVNSLDQIPTEFYDRLLKDAKENFVKRQSAFAEKVNEQEEPEDA
jgi:hypothetical protein